MNKEERHKNRFGFVYRIFCVKNNRAYVGYTINPHGYPKGWGISRMGQHASMLNKGTHIRRALQRDWNKYGSDAFELEILETINCDDFETFPDFKRFVQAREAHHMFNCYSIYNHEVMQHRIKNLMQQSGLSDVNEMLELIAVGEVGIRFVETKCTIFVDESQ